MKRDTPIDVRDALKIRRRLYINVPRTFPDNSLPWVIARDLLTLELDGKQVIPIVVDGSVIGPPRRTVEHCAYLSFSHFHRDRYQFVFILDSVPLGSKTKTEFLLDQLSFLSERPLYLCCARGQRDKGWE